MAAAALSSHELGIVSPHRTAPFLFQFLPLKRLALLRTHAIASSSRASETSTSLSLNASRDTSEPISQRPTWRASLDFKWIRENKELIAQNIKDRNSDADVEKVVEIYDKTFVLAKEVERIRAERNNVASRVKSKLDAEKRNELIEDGKRLKEMLAGLETELTTLNEELQQEGQKLPNMIHPNVPRGEEAEATTVKEVGSKSMFNFPVKTHVQLGEELDLIDFEAAAEVSGNKFYYLKNEAVLLEMALLNWTLFKLIERGFVPLSTPDLVHSSVIEKCGFQPRGLNTQIYSVEGTDLCLAGTAEIPIGGMYMGRILPEKVLPLKLAAFSHCFRTEAGAAGAATRGLYRVHQFSKLEIFVICKPDESEAFHEELISIEEDLFSALGFHFKILDMPSIDLGAPAYRKFDIEAWMPGLDRYGEISSASNCTDYQSRRLNIRYRPTEDIFEKSKQKGRGGPLPFVHTLNATACAVPRMMIAILENFQEEDGSISIPKVLQPYMGGREQILFKALEGM